MRSVTIKRTLIILGLSVVAMWSHVACSSTTRYRILSFFFEDVPEPGKAPVRGYPAPFGAAAQPGVDPPARVVATANVQPHPPYREHRCGRCHNLGTGELWRTAREGLCDSCHPDMFRRDRYVHGPVAVRDCLVCHHHHGSPRPHMLFDELNVVCQRCHDSTNLLTCEFRSSDEPQSCSECHAAHGGSNRFFLKRGEH